MRKQIIVISLITIILIIVLYPRSEVVDTYVGVENEVYQFEVTIDGAVNFPGTYVFFDDVTYYNLIEQAGGLDLNASDDEINYQKIISSNTEIYIPFITDEIDQVKLLVNINEATFSELLEIPYMTETKAANLIIYREQHGAFSSIDELINVKYIGNATLENIKDYITV